MGYPCSICPKYVNQQLVRLDMLHEALITSGCHDVERPILKIDFFTIRQWNSLDYSFIRLDSLSLFKRHIMINVVISVHNLNNISVYEQLPFGTPVCASECHSYLLISSPSALRLF